MGHWGFSGYCLMGWYHSPQLPTNYQLGCCWFLFWLFSEVRNLGIFFFLLSWSTFQDFHLWKLVIDAGAASTCKTRPHARWLFVNPWDLQVGLGNNSLWKLASQCTWYWQYSLWDRFICLYYKKWVPYVGLSTEEASIADLCVLIPEDACQEFVRICSLVSIHSKMETHPGCLPKLELDPHS